MRPEVWRPPVEPSLAERAVIKAVAAGESCSCSCVSIGTSCLMSGSRPSWAEAYVDSPKGQPPVPPARLALATIVQAYAGVYR